MDPDSLSPDPDTGDPAFQVNSDTPDPIRIQGFDDQKLKKNTAEIIFVSFLDQNSNLLAIANPAPDTDPGTPLNPDLDPDLQH